MPLFYPTESFFESSGNLAAEFPERIRDEVVGFACEIYEQFPDFVTNNKNPISSFSRGYMNSMCRGRINTPVLTPPTYTGGQCEGILYNINYRDRTYNVSNCNLVTDQDFTIQGTGALGEPYFFPTGQTVVTSCNGLSNATVEQGEWRLPTGSGDIVLSGGVFNDPSGQASPPLSEAIINAVSRVDGLPDDCGDPPSLYPPTNPTSNDLTKVVVVPVFNDVDLNFDLTYNQMSPEFNFPMAFKLNGVNVTLDFSGLTIYGDASYTNPNTNNTPQVPGYDGGNDGVGGDYTRLFPDFNFPTLPGFTVPEQVQDTLETALCTDGVIEVIDNVIDIIPGVSPVFKLVLGLLVQILGEICQEEDVPPVIGFPEYYGVKPGAGRPAIVYIYKEYDGTNYGASTYSSTVNQPRQTAIDEIPTVNIPDKTIGTFVASIQCIGGTRLRASGETKSGAEANLNFLLSKVDPAIIPVDTQDQIVVTEDGRLDVKTLVCRQIEYYPLGASANTTASIRRTIDQ